VHPTARTSRSKRLRSRIAMAGLLVLPLAMSSATLAYANMADIDQDEIVGRWVGQAAAPDQNPFDIRLTFVSPKGGISRYPGGSGCGGILDGDRDGDKYEYKETITFGGRDELGDDGCVDGTLHLTVDGDKMKLNWSAADNQGVSYSGELHRQAGRKR
jgi:hypothetical protein